MAPAPRSRWIRSSIGLLVLPGLATVAAGRSHAATPPEPPPPLTAEPLTPTDQITGSRAPTSRLAETDPELLGRTDDTPVEVLVKLDYDSIATYAGTVSGLEATSPAVTGEPLTRISAAEQDYEQYIVAQEASFTAALQEVVPEASVGQPLRAVYGGLRAIIPANRIGDALAIDGVVAIQEDVLLQLLTDSSPDFIGAPTLYSSLGGVANAGAGTIVGILDSGMWPEHPSVADQGNLGPAPRRFDGTPRTCDFGDNPLTPDVDRFVCNNKLIGGEAFLDTYLSNPQRAANEPYHTARDSNGHGTHTGSTAAGNAIDSAPVLGVERGPINGVAPGAWVSVYKVCGIQGCYASDSAAAVQQAIYDGVDVINFSISGGTEPADDPAELAFLDAYAAGVFVAASAGNDGPGAATANHVSPWTTTVAASTQQREFQSTLTVTAPGGATGPFTGASITDGVDTPAPVVLSSAPPYNRPLCDAPAPAGLFAGKIVACQRGVNARVEKGFNVLQGGAVGMILYNPTLADIETDNHWLPTVHLADGRPFLAFMAANPGVTATFTPGVAVDGQGDVMAAFSSRGPRGHFIKPDVTAPGVQILAGHTPTPESVVGGPPGEYFQAIAGTSMSSPHVAGAALLLTALHGDWTPGQIKSALMTTATQAVVKEDLVTPADPFDHGSGRIDLNVAGNPGLTFDALAEEMIALGNDPINAVHLNLPSINAPVMPGRITTTRTATNVTGQRVGYDVEVTAPESSSITVSPDRFMLRAGQSVELEITIEATGQAVQQFGEIRLVPSSPGLPALHLPVAFVPQQSTNLVLTQSCTPDEIDRRATSECAIEATNNGYVDAEVDLRTSVNRILSILSAEGATVVDGDAVLEGVVLQGALVGTPSIGPGRLFGYVPLSLVGVSPIAVGDETLVNFTVPAYEFAGRTYTRIGATSNGYLVAGGGTVQDINCCDPEIPDPARPNGVLAPFWTDLTGAGAPGIFAGVLRNGANRWLAIEWRLNVFGTTSQRVFQTWIGLNGVEDITFAYDPANLPADPNGKPFVVGAENELGTDGDTLDPGVLPTTDLRVVSSDPVPGESVSYSVVVRGDRLGHGIVTTEMVSPVVSGTTVVTSTIRVIRQ